MKKATVFYTGLILAISGALMNAHPVVLMGSDVLTVGIPNSKVGYDCVKQVACTSYTSSATCFNHFFLEPNIQNDNTWTYELWAYSWTGAQGYGINMGNVNLDSLNTAPPDSILSKNGQDVFDRIPVDSVQSRIGCSYWIRSGQDIYYANTMQFIKMRIIDFKIIDSASHKASMRFIYATERAGNKTAVTSNFDTFFRSTSTRTPHHASNSLHAHASNTVFKVAEDRFLLPPELVGAAGHLGIFDLTGKRLGRLAIGKSREIDLTGIRRRVQGVLLIRYEH